MANVIELKAGENPAESPYILVQVDAERTDSLTGSFSYGVVRWTPDDEDAIAREILYAQKEADEFAYKNVYVQRKPQGRV